MNDLRLAFQMWVYMVRLSLLRRNTAWASKGYLATAKDSIPATVIHIHGSCGNFYENAFIATMARLYTARGVNFLSFNNRGHDCIAEAYQNGRLVYVLAAPTRI